jgi:hypothetical protein
VEDDAVNAAGEREAVEKTFGIANGIFFFFVRARSMEQ